MSLEKAQAHLAKYGLEKRIIIPSESSATVELAAEALGVKEDEIAKTMSFLLHDQPIVIVMSGQARIDNHKYKETFHVKAKMVPFEEVEEIIGHAPGGVCPFGVHPGVKVYLDVSLKKHEIVYPAAGTSASALRLTIAELEKCAEAQGWVDVCKDPA